MITIHDYRGRVHHLNPHAIALISEASTSSQWHGIRAIVKTFDGGLIEARDDADTILRAYTEAARNPSSNPEPLSLKQP